MSIHLTSPIYACLWVVDVNWRWGLVPTTGENRDQVMVQGNQGGFGTQDIIKGRGAGRESIKQSTLIMDMFERGRQGWEGIHSKFLFQNFVLNCPYVSPQAAKFKLLSCRVLDSQSMKNK